MRDDLPQKKAGSKKRRSCRHRLRNTRATPEDVTSVDKVVTHSDNVVSVTDGEVVAPSDNVSSVGDEDAAPDPVATVTPDGAITFTISPQGADYEEKYGELLQWLREARTVANGMAAADGDEEDVDVTFTITITPHISSTSAAPQVAATDDAASRALPASSGLLEKPSSSKKRRTRRRKQKDARAAGDAVRAATADVTADAAPESHREVGSGEAEAAISEGVSSRAVCCGHCFSSLFNHLLGCFR